MLPLMEYTRRDLGLVDSTIAPVTTEDLRAIGVEVTPPNYLEHEMDY